MKIIAAISRSKGAPFDLAEVDLDDLRDDEILVRIKAVGICHTDLVARDEFDTLSRPAVFGHEGAGIVVKTGKAVTKVRPGDHVVLTIRSCGHCARCDAGEPSYCETSVALNYAGARPDGCTTLSLGGRPVSSNFFGQSSFASHAIAYEENVVRVDADVPFATLAPLGCGVQTGVGAVLRALACRSGSTIVITGGGSVGLSAVLGAAVAGCAQIVVSDPVAERRELAVRLGATHGHDPAAGDLASFVRAIRPAGFDHVLDTTGLAPVMEAALDCLRPHGTMGLLGIPADPAQRLPGLARKVLTHGYTIKGIIEGDSEPDSFIPELVALHREGRLPFDRLIRTYPFADINTAVEDQLAGRVVKAVLTFD